MEHNYFFSHHFVDDLGAKTYFLNFLFLFFFCLYREDLLDYRDIKIKFREEMQ